MSARKAVQVATKKIETTTTKGIAVKNSAIELEVIDEDSANVASAMLSGPVRAYREKVIALVDPVRKNANEYHKAATTLLKTLLVPADEAEAHIKNQISAWQVAERERRRKQEEEIRAQVEKERLEFEYDGHYDQAILDHMAWKQQREIDRQNAVNAQKALDSREQYEAENAPPATRPIPDAAPAQTAPVRQWQPPAAAAPAAAAPKVAGISTRFVQEAKIVDVELLLSKFIEGRVPSGEGIIVVSAAKLNKWVTKFTEETKGNAIDWESFGLVVTNRALTRRTGR